MRDRFVSVLAALGWYRRILLDGPSQRLRAHQYRERVRQGISRGLELALGEEALALRRIEAALSGLSPQEREILFGNDHRRLGLSSRNALYKRQHAIRRRLSPVFIAAELIDAPAITQNQEVIP